ncbi:MAG: hypothetical protein M3Q73_04155 [bacterium]|nr:hypothetical protein [bacterium]
MQNSVRLVGKKSTWPNIILGIAIAALVLWLLAWLSEQGYLNNLLGTETSNNQNLQTQEVYPTPIE